MRTDKIITKGKMKGKCSVFFCQIVSINSLRKCVKISQENWYVDTVIKSSMVKKGLFQV